ncbi:hypothetical protein QJS66_21845 [Kocuria rhizophila]|nr:hypothetical protein QJS66_21845 [Kocuria rhizophila]
MIGLAGPRRRAPPAPAAVPAAGRRRRTCTAPGRSPAPAVGSWPPRGQPCRACSTARAPFRACAAGGSA